MGNVNAETTGRVKDLVVVRALQGALDLGGSNVLGLRRYVPGFRCASPWAIGWHPVGVPM
jgi:hypothetical protein